MNRSQKNFCETSTIVKLLPLSRCLPPQVFTRYGKCYMFNAAEEGKTLRTTMKGGTGNGLEIMLDIQQDEYLPVWGDTGRPTHQVALPPSNVEPLPPPLPDSAGSFRPQSQLAMTI